jgi:hypothetical protein
MEITIKGMAEIRAVACNFSASTSAISKGSKAFVQLWNPGGGNDRVFVLARSRSGRWINKWEDVRRLCNFRVVTVVEESKHLYVCLKGAPDSVPAYLVSVSDARV